MNEDFFEYLGYSPRAMRDYLQFIVDIADITIKNRSNPEIKPETVEKARRCRKDALQRLAEMKRERPIHREEAPER